METSVSRDLKAQMFGQEERKDRPGREDSLGIGPRWGKSSPTQACPQPPPES